MLTTIGVWLLVVSAVAIVVEGVLAGVWAASLVKRSRALSEGIEAQRACQGNFRVIVAVEAGNITVVRGGHLLLRLQCGQLCLLLRRAGLLR